MYSITSPSTLTWDQTFQRGIQSFSEELAVGIIIVTLGEWVNFTLLVRPDY